jgi:polysaccharide pyruvyl transferase WcaK-like protein
MRTNLAMPAGPRPGTRVRVGLLGMYASANLGDTAIQTAVMLALLRRRPDIEFVGLCTDPVDAVQTFGIRARHLSCESAMLLPPRNGHVQPVPGGDPGISFERLPAPLARCVSAWRIDRQMRELDMLLISGSGQIDDFWGGPWEQPFRLLAWTAAAARQGKPAAVFGVGVDQLLTRLGKVFCKQALQRAQLRVLRDAGSLDALRAMGLQAQTDVCPDPAFHLEAPPPPAAGGSRFAVISPIARNAWPGGSEPYEAYLGALAAAADHLQRQGVEVRFVCSQTRMDPPIVDHVRQRMRGDVGATRVMEVKTVDEYLREVGGAQVVVGSRLHAMILALVAGAPVVAVSYARKVQRQLQDFGLADYLLDLRDVQADKLLGRIDAVLREQVSLRAHIRRQATAFRAQLDMRFDRLTELVPHPGADPSPA